MGYKNNDPCLNKAEDDEPIFVLLARDETAPGTIEVWCTLNRGIQPPEKIVEAFEHAETMRQWRKEHRP